MIEIILRVLQELIGDLLFNVARKIQDWLALTPDRPRLTFIRAARGYWGGLISNF